ncbi:MAG: outer membrane lipoprotein carrier protein LolA [Paludibacter sp.]
MYRKIGLFVLLFSFLFAKAQNNLQAEQILSDLLNSAKTTAIKTNFKLMVSEKNDSQTQSSSGSFTLKGTKFILEMEALKLWFDGKTQWSYVQQNNEVSITEPSEKELAETNPMAILSGFKSKCLIRFSSKTKSEQNYCLEMVPKLKNKDLVKIEVQVNKNNGNLFLICIYYTNGSKSTLLLSNFQKNISIAETNFVFNSAKHKGVTINDLR